VHLDLAGIITTEKRFHVSEIFPEQHFFSHVTIFRRKNVLAGISRRPKIPERALNIARHSMVDVVSLDMDCIHNRILNFPYVIEQCQILYRFIS